MHINTSTARLYTGIRLSKFYTNIYKTAGRRNTAIITGILRPAVLFKTLKSSLTRHADDFIYKIYSIIILRESIKRPA